MEKTRYKGWLIEPQSFESDHHRWRPKALVRIVDGGVARVHQVPAPPSVTFDTEWEAESYAVVMAKKWGSSWK